MSDQDPFALITELLGEHERDLIRHAQLLDVVVVALDDLARYAGAVEIVDELRASVRAILDTEQVIDDE